MRLSGFLVVKACLGLIWALSAMVCTRADDLPTKLNFERYKAMLEHSPFAVASAVVAPAVAPNFAKDLYVANAARSPDGDMVTIASTSDKDFKKYLTTKTPVDGYAIASIEWSDKVGETKVTISKDGQMATLAFNQMLLVQPLPNRPSAGVPPAVLQSGFQRPIGFPTPTPHVLRRDSTKPANAPATADHPTRRAGGCGSNGSPARMLNAAILKFRLLKAS